MVSWQLEHQDLLVRLESEPSLLPLIHNVFNKVFSLLQLFKENGDVPVNGETLPDFVKRFEYITVNAFSSFLVNDSIVVKANTAQTKTLATLRNYKQFRSSERVFTRNVAHLLDLDSKKARNKKKVSNRLLEAIWDHPIFSLRNEDSAEYFLERRKGDSTSTSKGSSEKSKKKLIPKSKTVDNVVASAGGYAVGRVAGWASKNQSAEEIEQTIKKIEVEIEKYPEKPRDNSKVMRVLNELKQAREGGK